MDRDETIIKLGSSPLTRRRVLAGGAGIGVAALAGATLAYAQSATPSPGTGTTGDQSSSDAQAMAAQAYQTFVSDLTTNLGLTDTAATDQAIRTSLSQEVDTLLSQGHISQDEATALKQRIASADVPLPIGLGWRGRRAEHGVRRGPRNNGGEMGAQNDQPSGSSSPSASPSS